MEGEVWRKERYGGRRGMEVGEVLRKDSYGGRNSIEEGEVRRKERYEEGDMRRKRC